MKRQTTLAMFGILFAAAMALGMISVSGFSQPLFVASTDTKAVNHLSMVGHITFTATDEDGNILSYIQTDNLIVNVGENCVAESIFNVTSGGAQPCTGIGTQTVPTADNNGVADGGFTYIAIGDGTTTPNGTDTTLSGTEIDRIKDNMTSISNSEGGAAGTQAIVTISETFTATVASNVTESGLFDSNAAGNMLARQVFGAIPLTIGDKLTVEWEIKIG